MTPVEQLDDHRRRPRNLGKLLNASAVGDVGSIVAGDALRFYVKIVEERITEARFQVFNAADQVATTSVITELVVGKPVAEAVRLGPTDVCGHLGGLDPAELPPIVWGLEGVRAAVASWTGAEQTHDEDLDPLLCRCHGIPEETVRQSIAVMQLADVQAVVDATGAGTGCGSCRTDLPRLIDEVRGAPAKPEPARRAGPQGRIPTLRRIQALVADKIQPRATAQGGGIELWDFDGTVVAVRVRGLDEALARQLLSDLEIALKAEIDPQLGVSLA